jgi:hypothetical protein
MDKNFTFECKFFFKAYRIVEGDWDLSLMFTSLVTLSPIFGSNDGSKDGKSFSKALKRWIASRNLLSTSLDVQSPASAADFNASSAASNTLFISEWNGVDHR